MEEDDEDQEFHGEDLNVQAELQRDAGLDDESDDNLPLSRFIRTGAPSTGPGGGNPRLDEMVCKECCRKVNRKTREPVQCTCDFCGFSMHEQCADEVVEKYFGPLGLMTSKLFCEEC